MKGYRKRLSKRASRKEFKRTARKTNVMNVSRKVSRGGIQL